MSDSLRLDEAGPVLVVGGYGVVGAELAAMAAPQWPLLLTGRTPERGAALAERLGVDGGQVEVRRWDLADPAEFAAPVRAVVSAVNDPDDRVLRAALAAGVPYVDITRWTARLQRAATMTALTEPSAPVLLSSGWMGGVTNLVASALAAELGGVDAVEVAIRWDLADQAGADSVEFMDRLGLDYEVIQDGQRRMVMPLSDTRRVRIGDTATCVARIDTPEQFTLPLTLGATTATTRIGFGSTTTTSALLAVKRTGLFRWGRGDRFTALRRALLYSPGQGGTARVRLDITYRDRAAAVTVSDPRGQAHLTAVGALAGLHRVLGTDGAPPPRGMVFPEMTPQPEKVPDFLQQVGVQLLRHADTSARAA